jgi:hypothetical protein
MPGSASAWETSATFFHAVMMALDELGQRQAVWAVASPQVKELIDFPQSRSWWSAELSLELSASAAGSWCSEWRRARRWARWAG